MTEAFKGFTHSLIAAENALRENAERSLENLIMEDYLRGGHNNLIKRGGQMSNFELEIGVKEIVESLKRLEEHLSTIADHYNKPDQEDVCSRLEAQYKAVEERREEMERYLYETNSVLKDAMRLRATYEKACSRSGNSSTVHPIDFDKQMEAVIKAHKDTGKCATSHGKPQAMPDPEDIARRDEILMREEMKYGLGGL